jgi:hypothetical protein
MDSRQLALLIPRVLPGWLSDLAMALIFLAVWNTPEFFGWDSMRGLQTAVFIEVAAVYAFLLLLTALEDPTGWISVVYAAIVLAIILFSTAGLWVALVLPLHLVARLAALWSDDRTARSVTKSLIATILLMSFCWLIVGIGPVPNFGWTAASTPLALWLDVPSFSGFRRVSFGLPAWAFFYFGLSAIGGLFRSFVHFVERTGHKSPMKAA